MERNKRTLLSEVSEYYSGRLSEYGETPRGVDWNGEESQIIRFEQLCRIVDGPSGGFSINDLGCGYGALLDYLLPRYAITSYLGVDVSEEMVSAAKVRHNAVHEARFIAAAEPDALADYGIASGIFNVRLERSDAEWFDYLESTLDTLNRTSLKGFAFNCLTLYSDEGKMHDHLYYADPCKLFDLCKKQYSRQVALMHDYGLFEFTILVRK